jgi:Fic family protein
VLSSRIEGTQASLSDLYAYEAVQLSLFESPPDVREVFNYVKALEYGLERLETLPLSLRLLREIHAELMTGVRGEYQTPGEFRRSSNWIGPPGSNLNTAPFVPPAVDEMQTALDAFEKYLYAAPYWPPLIRLGLIHYQFEAIHPFLDGNGRMGRLLITLLLVSWKLLPSPLLYLSAYIEANRQSYYDLLLAVSQRGDWAAWLLFFLQGVASQSLDAVVRAERLQTLRESYRRQLQQQRASSKLLQTIDMLFVRPVVTVQQLEETLAVSFATAGKYVNQLQAQGILREITGQARNRIFLAEAILHAIDDPLPPKETE